MYNCIHVWICIYVCVYIYLCLHVSTKGMYTYVNKYTCKYNVHICRYVCVCMYKHVCICVCLYIGMYACCMCMYVWMIVYNCILLRVQPSPMLLYTVSPSQLPDWLLFCVTRVTLSRQTD